MKPFNQNLVQNIELTHDVPVTKSIFSHAGIFITIVFVLFLGAEARNITRQAAGQHFSDQSLTKNSSLAINNHSGLKKF